MAITKAICPECGAKLSSPDGFDIGEEVECPKCETAFQVRAPKPAKPQVVEDDDEEEKKPEPKAKKKREPEPDDDDDYEDEKPKKKKKKGKRSEDADEKSYKNSPLRFVILGVLVLAMLIGGALLIRKILKERAVNEARVHPTGTSFARTASQMSAITLVAVA